MTQHIRWLGISIALTVLIADLCSKTFVVSFLTERGGVFELFPFLNLRLGYNRGVSFGMLQSPSDSRPWVLALFAFSVSVYLMTQLWRAKNKIDVVWTGLIIGGALGNATDRLIDEVVTDFIDLHVFGIHWPSFNLADIAIVLGISIVILRSFRFWGT